MPLISACRSLQPSGRVKKGWTNSSSYSGVCRGWMEVLKRRETRGEPLGRTEDHTEQRTRTPGRIWRAWWYGSNTTHREALRLEPKRTLGQTIATYLACSCKGKAGGAGEQGKWEEMWLNLPQIGAWSWKPSRSGRGFELTCKLWKDFKQWDVFPVKRILARGWKWSRQDCWAGGCSSCLGERC